jgi:hypothetical protein
MQVRTAENALYVGASTPESKFADNPKGAQMTWKNKLQELLGRNTRI